jgi:hypothetical protein
MKTKFFQFKSYYEDWNIHFWSLGLLIIIALFLSLLSIEKGEQHVDVYQVMGVFDWSWAQLMKEFFTNPSGVYGGFQAPLYFILAKLYGSMFCSDLICLTIFSVIGFVLIVTVSWFSYPIITGNNNHLFRFLFTLLIAISPVFIWWAQTAKYNIWFTLISVLTLVAGMSFIHKKDFPRMFLFSIVAAATIYTHYYGVIIVFSMCFIKMIIAVYQRNLSFVLHIVYSSLIMIVLLAPLLPNLFQAIILRMNEGYHFVNGSTSFSSICRGILIEWFFGYGLIFFKSEGLLIAEAYNSIVNGQITNAITLLIEVKLFIIAIVTFLLLSGQAIYQITKRHLLQIKSVYILGVPFLSIVISEIIGLSFRFSYLGMGTFCLIGFFFMGLPYYKKNIIPLALLIVTLSLYGVSLTNYYKNMHLRYPGMWLVSEYINNHLPNSNNIIIHKWITDNRGTDQEYKLSSKHFYTYITSISEIKFPKKGKTVVFLAGRPNDLINNFEQIIQKREAIQFRLLNTWQSMELAERSIIAIEVVI